MNKLRIFIPFALGYFLSYLYRTINAVLAPNLAADIGVDPSELGLLTAAYFITFAAFQLPLGVLLDRYGPRRIEAALLLVAAAGAMVFANATSLAGLVIGRGLIGFGVSACLMAAFKAFTLGFESAQLPRINGFQMAAGGLGALTATAPVEVALAITDWRGVFTLLAVLTMGVAAVIFFVVPEQREEGRELRFSDQIRGIGAVLGSPRFWRIAPWATLSQATYLAIHGLWSGPWLRDVAGMDRAGVATTLSGVAVAMIAGYLTMGTLAARLSRRGIAPMTVAAVGMTLCMVQLGIIASGHQLGLIASGPAAGARIWWWIFGFLGTSSILPYAVLSQSFPLHLAGRANTALNLLVFVAAFSGQWGIGVLIGLWPATASGYDPAGYGVAFAVMLALQAVTAVWFAWATVRMRKRGAL